MIAETHAAEVPASLVIRLRKQTGLPLMECKHFLERFTPEERIRLVELRESQTDTFVHDPIEDNPSIRSLFEAVRAEVNGVVTEEHRKRIAELEESSPTVESLFRGGRGLCHREWQLTKKLMKERHGIEWQSPADLNPWVIFD